MKDENFVQIDRLENCGTVGAKSQQDIRDTRMIFP